MGLTVKDYKDNTKNTAAKIVWGATASCDANYWVTATGCQGSAVPWGLNTAVAYVAPLTTPTVVAEVKGSLRAWHFLADKGANKAQVWSIEGNDVLDCLFYEYIERSAGAAAAGAAYANADVFRWDVKTATIKAGATSTLLGYAALIAGTIQTLF